MWTDLEDVWPSARSLVGVRLERPEDQDRCREIAWQHPEAFVYLGQEASALVEVRRADLHLLDEAGIAYTTVELVDLDTLPTEERLASERAAVAHGMALLRERLRTERPV